MSEERNQIDKIIDELKTVRDELEVQMHLAAADAKDEWAELEKKWQKLSSRAKSVGETADEVADDVGTAVGQVVDELKKGYDRIRKAL